tara:strand:+ start:1103 stop:1639 length:537 start_codon:yes stop_codon:yes gene_type:complete
MYFPPILVTARRHGASVFTGERFDLNVIAIRRKDRMDDLAVAYRIDGRWVVEWFEANTTPTSKYLKRPINVKGTAIIAAGFYKSAYALGMHRGRPAVIQVAPLTVHRDNNLDEEPDTNTKTETGLFAINIHSGLGGDYSAGCILMDASGISRLRTLMEAQKTNGFGDRVSLTLLNGAR